MNPAESLSLALWLIPAWVLSIPIQHVRDRRRCDRDLAADPGLTARRTLTVLAGEPDPYAHECGWCTTFRRPVIIRGVDVALFAFACFAGAFFLVCALRRWDLLGLGGGAFFCAAAYCIGRDASRSLQEPP